MKSAGVLENADQLKNIMAREISLAMERRSNQAVYRASAKLSRNLTVEAKARDFTFYIDEPASFGGADKGPNPEEVVLAAVGACQAITAALYAALLGIEIKRYEVDLKGYLDLGGFYGTGGGERPTGFERVVCEVVIESDAPAKKLKEFERMVEERCVGHGTLRTPVAIESHWTINDQRVG